MRDQRYIEIPGSKTHGLPPLLVHSTEEQEPEESTVELASVMSEAEDMLAASDEDQETVEQRKFELALQLAEQYRSWWRIGSGAMGFWSGFASAKPRSSNENTLRQLLHPDVWPHANRASFVTLLADKGVGTPRVELERAVGLRLTFRHPPPIDCVSNQFLFYLNSKIAGTAYRTWSHLVPHEAAAFPPERFHFEVLSIGN